MIEATNDAQSLERSRKRAARLATTAANQLDEIRPGVLHSDSRVAADAAEAAAVLDIVRELSGQPTETPDNEAQADIADAATRAAETASLSERYIRTPSSFEDRASFCQIDLRGIDTSTLVPEALLPTDFLDFIPGNSTHAEARELSFALAAEQLGLPDIDLPEFFVWCGKLKETHSFVSGHWPTFSGLTQDQSRELILAANEYFDLAAMKAEAVRSHERRVPISRLRAAVASIRADIDIALLTVLGQAVHLPHKLTLDPYGRTTAIIHQLKQMTHHE